MRENVLHLLKSRLILPLFVVEEPIRDIEEIPSMKKCYRSSLKETVKIAKQAEEIGITGIALFPAVPERKKNSYGTEALNDRGIIPETIRAIKNECPNVKIITDVALDPYSSDGHDGVVVDGQIVNDLSVECLVKMALAQARAGADILAPSDMMDRRVYHIRSALDNEGYRDVGIISYTAKYASSFYGPFRDALQSAPKFGDKKTYQMDFRNSNEAIKETILDIEEGADAVMVKPALSYLDVIASVKKKTREISSETLVMAYQVSGEYSILRKGLEDNILSTKEAILEPIDSIYRAGADCIFTYFAIDYLASKAS